MSPDQAIGAARATDLLAAWAVHFAGTGATGFARAAVDAAGDLGRSLRTDHLSLDLALPSRDGRQRAAWTRAGTAEPEQELRRALVDAAGDRLLAVAGPDAATTPEPLREPLRRAGVGSCVLVPLGAPADDPGHGPELTTGSHLLAARADPAPWPADAVAVLRGAGRVAAATYLVAHGVAGAEHHPAVAEALRTIGHRDPVTGLGNRVGLREQLDELLGRDRPVTVAFLDLERYKRINDTLGHLLGDRLLARVAEQLRTLLADRAPEGSRAYRFNSADFVVVLPGRDERVAAALLEEVGRILAEPVSVDGHQVTLRCRGGISVGPRDGATADTLIGAADLAMLAAKNRGTARELFSPAMADEARTRLAIEERLPRALQDGGLNVVYQPLIDLRTGALAGIETLARWSDSELGTVSPGDFVPIASATGSIVALGRVVLDLTLRQAAIWRAAGCAAPAAVNVSAEELRTDDYADAVLRALDEHGLPPGALEVEISEATMIDHDEAAIRTLRRLEGAGVRLALDDFGARFSSLAHLRNVRVHHIKLDRDLVERVDSSVTDRAIVKAVVDVAEALGATVTGEGIERGGTIEALLELGVQVGQGHALGRPGPASAITARLAPAASAD